MIKKIVYDHAYTLDKNHRFLKELEKLGFLIEEQTVEHPGKAFCRFIMFNDPKNDHRQYLEFVDVRDKAIERKRQQSGLSFRYIYQLEKYYEKLKKKKSLSPSFQHKNYNWKENSKDRLPGWNFVAFKKLPFRKIYPWFTEYEPSPLRKKITKRRRHPNGAIEIVGIKISLNQKSKKFFSEILDRHIKNEVILGRGVKVYFKKSQKNRLERILVRVQSLKRFEPFLKKSRLSVERTERGYLIKNPYKRSQMYDLEIVE